MKDFPALLAVQRFGLGPRPGELAEARRDPRGWAAAQLRPAPLPDSMRGLPSSAEALRLTPGFASEQKRARRRGEGAAAPMPRSQEDRDQERDAGYAEIHARFDAGVRAAAPFHERLVRFWANHFSVAATRRSSPVLIGAYEREAIRPHATGRFADLLLAVVRHPAMLLYLDNDRSVGPDAPEAGGRGLNENLAREILELHTLGVDGGYTQADVTAFAGALTGWSIEYGAPDAGFRFHERRHQPGPQTVLGRRYAQDGQAQAEAVLRDLAAHPSTARHVARKLVRHFIADVPPPAAVEKVASAFRDSGGDLARVARAVLDLPEAFSAPMAKFRTPEEFLIGAQRLVGGGGRLNRPRQLYGALKRLGQIPFQAPSPQGWPDEAAAWLSADGLWKRLSWSTDFATHARVDRPLELAAATYGDALSASTRGLLEGAESGAQGLALLLASPEFNRR